MTPKRKRIIIYIVIGFILIGFFLIAFNLLKGKFEKDVEKIEKDFESEYSFQKETEFFNRETEESKSTEVYVENFHYYDYMDNRENLNYKDVDKDYSKVFKIYGVEDKEKQQKKFLGNLYDILMPIMDIVKTNSKSYFNMFSNIEIDLSQELFNVVESDELSEIHGTYTYDEIIKNPNENYSIVIGGCSVIDYFDDTTVICMCGYRDFLTRNLLFVFDTSDKLYDTTIEQYTLKIGDIYDTIYLVDGYYTIESVGDFNVIYAKLF